MFSLGGCGGQLYCAENKATNKMEVDMSNE